MSDLNTFDSLYSAIADGSYYDQPCELVKRVVQEWTSPSRRALDFGAGDGRNTVFLARNGFSVTAIDLSKAGLSKIEAAAVADRLPIRCVLGTYSDLDGSEQYDLVLAITVIDHMSPPEGRLALGVLQRVVAPGGVVIMSVFTRDDPGYLLSIGRQSQLPVSETAHLVRNFFQRGQLLSEFRFNEFELLDYSERREEDKSHGTPHWHSVARVLARKIDAREAEYAVP